MGRNGGRLGGWRRETGECEAEEGQAQQRHKESRCLPASGLLAACPASAWASCLQLTEESTGAQDCTGQLRKTRLEALFTQICNLPT